GSEGGANQPLYIGADHNPTAMGACYLDQIRFSTDERYPDGTTFSVPTAAFTDDSDTALLIQPTFEGGFGKDYSGAENHFSQTNLAATDQMIDTPTNNFATWNPVNTTSSTTLSEGNLAASCSGTQCALGTFSMTSGKWYWECLSTSAYNFCGAVADPTINSMLTSTGLLNRATAWAYRHDGKKQNGTTGAETWGNTFASGDIIGTALDMDNEKIWWSKNGVWQESGDPAAGTNPAYSGVFASQGVANGLVTGHGQYSGTVSQTLNMGQDSSFAGTKTAQGNQDGNGKGDFYYSPPSGFNSLCSENLPSPSIADPTAHFNTIAYSGDGGQSVSGVGFQPDLVWVKCRSFAYN
ncbi:MAG: hypothetical protein QF535_00615, partial [Anaerolineales bacterium]|nr:hypothetical protein [Anaerolineales bacterium]